MNATLDDGLTIRATMISRMALRSFAADILNNKKMNSDQASELSSDELVLEFIKRSLATQGEAATLSAIFNLFEYWDAQPSGPDIAALLFHFYDAQTSVGGTNLDLQEIQAGLTFKSNFDLWEKFLSIAADANSYGSLDTPLERMSLRQARGMKVNLLRRQNRLTEAQDLLDQALDGIEADSLLVEEIKLPIGFMYYENGYLLFLLNRIDEAIASFRKSSDLDFGAGDQVGGGISACLEFRLRYQAGMSSLQEFADFLGRMAILFARNSVPTVKKNGHARRWVLNCWTHLIELACDSGDEDLAEDAIKRIRELDSLFPDDSFLPLYEGIYNLTKGKFDHAIEVFSVAFKKKAKFDDPRRFTAPEGQSQLPFYIGRCHWKAGRLKDAREWLSAGAGLPSEPGNLTWRARAESSLRLLDLE